MLVGTCCTTAEDVVKIRIHLGTSCARIQGVLAHSKFQATVHRDSVKIRHISTAQEKRLSRNVAPSSLLGGSQAYMQPYYMLQQLLISWPPDSAVSPPIFFTLTLCDIQSCLSISVAASSPCLIISCKLCPG